MAGWSDWICNFTVVVGGILYVAFLYSHAWLFGVPVVLGA
jgi:hypothetical protein